MAVCRGLKNVAPLSQLLILAAMDYSKEANNYNSKQ